MKIFYTDSFTIPLAENHTFPIGKYALLRKRIENSNRFSPQQLCVPHAATDIEICRSHDPEYLQRLQQGQLTAKETRRIGLPWSQELVERARRSAGATVDACFAALDDGVAVHLGGGTHHAFKDRGQGYCVFNDSAIAVRALQADTHIKRVLILDCDVHQGNGTAALLQKDPNVFTFSIHGKNNFPFRKEKSDLDIALDDGTDDRVYLDALDNGIRASLKEAKADAVIYLAGADPFTEDRFGRLDVSKEGLAERDRLVLRYCRDAGLPVAVTMAGGYAPNIKDTVDIHFNTVCIAAEFQKS
ncbi:MAG: histone deacetylase [Desulfobacterales bacterium]|nr:histone deacetylase [Desulfobacterales bacterium]